jgi:aminoglycoside phosphotransferase (APT) family kinase protein
VSETVDDRIDAAAITALLAEHINPSLRCEKVVRAAVGNGQETWLIDAVDGAGTTRQLVLRRSASAGVLDDTDRQHEFATLQAVHGRGLPTPMAYWLETEPSSLHRPFFVMDRLPGRQAMPRTPEEAAAIAHDLGRRIAQLHEAIGPVDDGDVAATTRREIERWKSRYLSRRVAAVPMVGALLAWLEANVPVGDAKPLLLWGDAGPHNILVDGTQITAMLDWELSHTGHPMEDLGAAVWACLGRYPQDEVIAGYEEITGQAVARDEVAYFAVLGCVSRSIMQFAGVDSFIRGETTALNLAGLGLTLPTANLRRAAAYAGWPAIADGALTGPVTGPPDELRIRPDLTETLDGVARFLREDVLPTVESAHLQRGLKTAAALLATSAQRGREEPARTAELGTRIEALFERLEAAGVIEAGSGRDAVALELLAARVETDPLLADHRADVRGTLLADLTVRAASLDAITNLYGRDVEAGPGFSR